MIISAWPGCGKTTFVKQNKKIGIEVECWKYSKKDFLHNVIKDIVKVSHNYKYVLISTNLVVLKEVIKLKMNPVLYYPDKSLKYEYLERYIVRESPYDFIGVFMSLWDTWLNELNAIKCLKVKLNSSEYLSNFIN